MKFIDRDKEIETLNSEYHRSGASMVILFGRRRNGKTTLIQHFTEGKKCIYYLATEENESVNLKSFKNVTAAVLDNSLLAAAEVSEWETVFDVILQSLTDQEKTIVVLDEFQYLGKANPAFPSILQKIWDEKLKRENIMLILCGSLIRMMKSQALNYDSPLYGRRTAQIRLDQIPFSMYSQFMPTMDEDSLIQRYAVTGGVPKYIEQFENDEDLYTAIEKNILNTNSFLYAEPEFLLQKEVSEIGSYFSLLRVIAQGNEKLSTISSAAGIKQTAVTPYLAILSELEIVGREVPVTESNPAKSKKGRYFIKDNFLRLWFRFVYPYRGMIESNHAEFVMNVIRNHFIDNHLSYVYENICREKMWEYNGKLFTFDKVGRWWGEKGIDIVAYDSMGQNIIFGECKYSSTPKGMDVLLSLQKKAPYVKWNNQKRKEYFVLFSRSGYSDALKQYAKVHANVFLL